jgi:LacI family transcriptional regulator
MLGVIVRDAEDPFFAAIIKAIQRHARTRGYEIILASVGLEPEQARAFRRAFTMELCDGIIVIGHLPGDERIISEIATASRNTVGVARLSARDPFPAIGFDNEKAATLAMEHLRSLGHTRIAFIGTGRLPSFQQRLDIYRSIMRRDGLEVREGFVQLCEYHDPEHGYRAMQALCDLASPPEAVVICNDLMAIGALSAARSAGLQVPQDISIVSFDDISLARYACPPLTTVRFPAVEMGERAVQVMMGLLEDVDVAKEGNTLLLEPVLIERQSTAAPRRAPSALASG